MSHLIYFHSYHFHHREYYELTTACFPVGLVSLMDRVLKSGHRKGQGGIPAYLWYSISLSIITFSEDLGSGTRR